MVSMELYMNRKFSPLLALLAVLTLSSGAFGQDSGTTTSFSWLADIAGALGPIAALIWWILFASWGGFRWISN